MLELIFLIEDYKDCNFYNNYLIYKIMNFIIRKENN